MLGDDIVDEMPLFGPKGVEDVKLLGGQLRARGSLNTARMMSSRGKITLDDRLMRFGGWDVDQVSFVSFSEYLSL